MGSFFDGIGKLFEGYSLPKLAVDALGVYGNISSKKAGEAQALQLADKNFENQKALADQRFQQELELLKLKQAMGGGGGGGGTDMRPYYLQQQGDAYTNWGQRNEQASGLTVQALKNLMDAAQRPLLK